SRDDWSESFRPQPNIGGVTRRDKSPGDDWHNSQSAPYSNADVTAGGCSCCTTLASLKHYSLLRCYFQLQYPPRQNPLRFAGRSMWDGCPGAMAPSKKLSINGQPNTA